MTTQARSHGPGPTEAAGSRSHKPDVLIAVIVVPLIFAITLLTFAWPSARLEPRDVPIGLAGPDAATRPLEQRLSRDPDAFELHSYANGQEARAAIEDREVYGAIVASADGLRLLTSSAASPLIAGVLQSGFAEAAEAGPASAAQNVAQTEDVVAADPDDPRGSVLSSLVLPLVLSSVIAAVIASLFGRPGLRQTGALVGASVLAGVVGIALVQSWLGAFGGDWFVNAGVLSLTMLAIAAAIAGTVAFLGHAGLALGSLTMVLLGNPWSGVSSAPELLPEPIGLIGQLLPPGAGGNLLRSTAFFDGADSVGHLTVLLVWAALGLTAIWGAALLRQRRTATGSAAVERSIPSGQPT